MLKRRCRIVNADISEDEIETMLDEGKTQMFNASILDDTTKAREQLNELKGRKKFKYLYLLTSKQNLPIE